MSHPAGPASAVGHDGRAASHSSIMLGARTALIEDVSRFSPLIATTTAAAVSPYPHGTKDPILSQHVNIGAQHGKVHSRHHPQGRFRGPDPVAPADGDRRPSASRGVVPIL